MTFKEYFKRVHTCAKWQYRWGVFCEMVKDFNQSTFACFVLALQGLGCLCMLVLLPAWMVFKLMWDYGLLLLVMPFYLTEETAAKLDETVINV